MPLAFQDRVDVAIGESLRERRVRSGSLGDRGRRLRVGLVNNMPDSAVDQTRRQFARIIADASDAFDIQLSLWTLESLERGEEARREISAAYLPARALRGASLDALIVTGSEPRALDLVDEPYWRELTDVFDWAEARTLSTMFSCLAAHAAVRYRDGVARRRLSAKCSGVVASQIVAAHELTADFGAAPMTPHSRWNGLDERDLITKGYRILTRSPEVGVDLFIKEAKSLLVFLHGHPEYEPDTLAREFRRDALRFLRGERPAPPSVPVNYYTPEREVRLRDFLSSDGAAENFPAEALDMREAPWRATSQTLFRNWLRLLARRKAGEHFDSVPVKRWGG